MKKLIYVVLVSCVLLCACRHVDTDAVLRQADAVAIAKPDSAMHLLALIEEPDQLPFEEKILYGWLRAYIHDKWEVSMAEDSLIMPAADYYISCRDTGKMLTSYLLKSGYLYWQQKHKRSMAVLDSGIAEAAACKDTGKLVDMLAVKGYRYVYVWKDYNKAVKTFRWAIALRENANLCFSQAVAMALQDNDSAAFYMNRSVELGLQEGDTALVAKSLRNYAQVLTYFSKDYKQVASVVRHLEKVSKDERQRMVAYLTLTECFLKMGTIDSARYYLEKSKVLAGHYPKFITTENIISQYQTVIDYVTHRTFDIVQVMRYNDSLWNSMAEQRSTERRKEESKVYLEQANLRLTVEHQQSQLTLMFTLLALVVVGGGGFLYARNRRNRLIEAEERIETLKRLLADAMKSGGGEERNGESVNDVEDGQFFRKILLQQLGIIRLVATQPTSQNQELLRRISGITNRELPVESLLVWEDLYPVIDRVYEDFYTKMNRRFGSVLIDKEQQLCCLLRAEFSTKEISVVTQQSIPTIYQRKTTIRKKLAMSEKEDIVGFILAE